MKRDTALFLIYLPFSVAAYAIIYSELGGKAVIGLMLLESAHIIRSHW